MNTIPALSEQQIRQRVGEQSFQRGQEYARSGAIDRAIAEPTRGAGQDRQELLDLVDA